MPASLDTSRSIQAPTSQPGYTPLPAPLRITEQSWPEGTVPLVSIICAAFKHEKFIAECIDGFLMQETTFPVEILIHEDASPDGTAAIIRKYEARYSRLIRCLYQTENQYQPPFPPPPVRPPALSTAFTPKANP